MPSKPTRGRLIIGLLEIHRRKPSKEYKAVISFPIVQGVPLAEVGSRRIRKERLLLRA